MTTTATSSAQRYVGWATQGSEGTPASSPSIFLPILRNGTSLAWVKNNQEIIEATGDYYVEVDSIPQQPHAQITISMPFRPTQLNSFLAACCMPGGNLIPPVPCTFFDGLGVDEDVYSDCYFTGGTIDVPSQGQCVLNMSFLGMQEKVPGAKHTVTFLNYERPYLHSDLQPATLIGSATVNKFDTVQIQIICDLTLEWLTRGDGKNQPSDQILHRLNAAVNFKRAYTSATEKAKFLGECNQPGVISFQLATSCSGSAHTFTVAWTNGVYTADGNESPDNSYIAEMLTARGLRNTGGSPSPATITVT